MVRPRARHAATRPPARATLRAFRVTVIDPLATQPSPGGSTRAPRAPLTVRHGEATRKPTLKHRPVRPLRSMRRPEAGGGVHRGNAVPLPARAVDVMRWG